MKDDRNKDTDIDTDEVTGLEATVAPEVVSGVEETVMAGGEEPVSGVEETVMAGGKEPVSGVEETVMADSGAPAERRRRADEVDLEALVTVERGHYSEGAEFARGGMGRIVAARDRRLGRPVALKELLVARPELARRFEREARITGRLQHPSIVPIYEHGRWPSGEPFYAMKHITGRPLSDLIAEAGSASERLALLPKITAVAEAMAYAHSLRVIHRDIKPQNVLVGAYGETVVIDWGLAKELGEVEDDEILDDGAIDGASDLTMVGSVMGTPAYMPPEQARGEAVDARADVYAVGAILYNCLSGLPPYRGKTSDMVITALLSGPPRRLREMQPDLPPDLLSIVDKAMAAEPGDRYPTADELAADLRRYQTGQLVGAHHYGGAALIWRWVKKNRVAVSISALFLAVLAVVGLWSVGRIVRERNRAEQERARAVRASGRARENAALARRSEAAATARLATFYADEGRREMLAAHPMRALAFLAEARRLGHRSPALRILLARAARLTRPREAAVAAHGRPISFAGFTSDGRTLVTAGMDGAVKRWAVPAGTLRDECPLPGLPLSLAPDLSHVVVGQLLHWDLALVNNVTCARRCVLEGLKPPGALRVIHSADGRRIAAADSKGMVMVWDAATCRPVTTLDFAPKAPPAPTPTVPGTPLLPTASPEMPIRLFEGSLSADGRWLALATPRHGVELYDTRTGKLLGTTPSGHAKRIVQIAIGPGNKRLLTASADGTARLWNAQTRTLERELKGHRLALTTAAFSPDGKRVATASLDATARLWDANSGRLLASLEGHGKAVKRIRFGPAGRRLVTVGDDVALGVWDAWSGAFHAFFRGHLDHITRAVFDPKGRRVASVGHDHRFHLWNATLGVSRHQVSQRVLFTALSPDGARMLLVGDKGELRVGSTVPGAPLVQLGAGGAQVTAAAFGPAGRLLLVARLDGTVALWDAIRRKRLRLLKGHKEQVTGVGFGPQGKWLVTTSWDETARVWDRTTGKTIHVLRGHNGLALQATFSPDRRLLATLSADGLARVWNARTGHLLAATGVSGNKLVAAQFSADSQRLITVSESLRILTWRSADGAMLGSVEAQAGSFHQAWIAGGGQLVLTSGWKSSQLWDVATGKLLARYSGGGKAAISADARRVITVDPKLRLPSIRVVPWTRLTDAALAKLVRRSPWVIRNRRLVRRQGKPSWLRTKSRPAVEGPLIDDPLLGLRIDPLAGWGVELGAEQYALERRVGGVRLQVTVSLGKTALGKDLNAFVKRVLDKELGINFGVTHRWLRFATRPALLLSGPRLSGQATIRWLVVPRGNKPLRIQLSLEGATYDSPEALRMMARLEDAIRVGTPWRETPATRKRGLPFGGSLAHIALPGGWKVKKVGPGAQVELLAPDGGVGLLRVLGLNGAVWCEKGRRFPTPGKVRLGKHSALRYACPADDKEQIFYTVRVGRYLLYVGLTDKRTKGLAGDVTRFPSLITFLAK